MSDMRIQENNYAFIDSQNLNLGIKSLGWKLDFVKYRRYLREKYGVTTAYLFIGYVPYVKTCSSLLKKSAKEKIIFMDNLKEKLEYRGFSIANNALKIEKAPQQDGT